MNKIIKEVAVLGSGVMGSRIAAHFANIGCKAYLLDIVPKELSETEKAKSLTLQDKVVRNRIADENLALILKQNPASLYHKSFGSRIITGNFEDDMNVVGKVDWIIEAVVENLNIKKIVFDNVEKFRKPGTLVTTNTSGIPINSMIEGRSEDFRKNFCGAHFFNPPRYLQLLEVIPSNETLPEVVNFLMKYGDVYLGKTTVLAKDTPAFIANRIGVYSMMSVLKYKSEMNLTIKEVDTLTGPISGKPKSATFRTADVVGLDTFVKVATNIYNDCPNDEERDIFQVPEYIQKMVANGWLGDKTKQGFYKKTKDANGKKDIHELNTDILEYQPSEKVKFASITAAKPVDDLKDRLKMLHYFQDKSGEFLRKTTFSIFKYASNRLPEISDELYKIDDGMKAGFGWELGPFEIWDAVGVGKSIELMKEMQMLPADWVLEMLSAENKSFYKVENGTRKYYDIPSKSYKEITTKKDFIILDNLRGNSPVWSNSGTVLHDLGDGILNLEFRTKMNSIGSEVLQGIIKSIEIAENDGWKGLVIANNGQHFSAGANLAMMFMLATEQEFEEIDMAVRMFQKATMRVRYSAIPIVVAPHSLTLGGGCEVALHADSVQAAAETYIGLVEVGVGIIPAGGGTKEMTLRASDTYVEGGIELPELQRRFLNIAMAKVSTSAREAFDLGIFRHGFDNYTLNKDRLILNAKNQAILLADKGYTKPIEREDVKVLGRSALGALMLGAYSFKVGNYISEHDKKIAEKLAYIMCGGDLSEGTLVSEQYLLDLEREAFLSLIGERKTQERIQSILTSGKPLRN